MKSLSAAVCVLIAGFLASPARAANVTWTLQNADFGVGLISAGTGGVTGSFVYDADTRTYSSINLTSNYGSADTLLSFTDSSRLWVVNGTGDLTGDFAIYLNFVSSPTDAGGSINLYQVAAGACQVSDCARMTPAGISYSSPGDAGPQGAIVAGAPEPAPGLLAVSGLVALWSAGKRRRRAA